MSHAANKRRDWSAWHVGDDEVRVQVNRPDMARAFAKAKNVRRVGYSVCGNFMQLYHVRQTVAWVDEWMKQFMANASSGAAEQKETR